VEGGEVLADPQTSGGYLFACPPDKTSAALIAIQKICPEAKCIGRVTMGKSIVVKSFASDAGESF
jgi:selenophosphate synthase